MLMKSLCSVHRTGPPLLTWINFNLSIDWISNHVPDKVLDDISYPFPDFNGCIYHNNDDGRTQTYSHYVAIYIWTMFHIENRWSALLLIVFCPERLWPLIQHKPATGSNSFTVIWNIGLYREKNAFIKETPFENIARRKSTNLPRIQTVNMWKSVYLR